MNESRFEVARKVADAVLYEGYVLYPYRASATKNRARFQWGVVVPPAYAQRDRSETDTLFTDLLLDQGAEGRVTARLRYLQLQARTVQRRVDDAYVEADELRIGGRHVLPFDEAVEHTVDAEVEIAALLEGSREVPFVAAGGEDAELVGSPPQGRIVRRREEVRGLVALRAEVLPGPHGVVKVRIAVSNTTACTQVPERRDDGLRCSLIAAHVLVAAEGARFISLLEPPEWAAPYVRACERSVLFPVIVGEPGHDDVMLASPIILYDHPKVAPESPGQLYDATEIDELLLLRTMTLTDEEKDEARATDERAAGVIEGAEELPPEILERLHGAIRFMRRAGASSPAGVPDAGASPPDRGAGPAPWPARGPGIAAVGAGVPRGEGPRGPWWDPGEDRSVSPETDSIDIDGVPVARGSRVRLHPRVGSADAQDMFVEGRTARVEAVFHDVDGRDHLAITLEDDPTAELHSWYGRFMYFSPAEVEPLGSDEPEAG